MNIHGQPEDIPLTNEGEVLWLSIICLLAIGLIWVGSMQLEYEAQRQFACERVGEQMFWNPDTDLCEVKPLPALKY